MTHTGNQSKDLKPVVQRTACKLLITLKHVSQDTEKLNITFIKHPKV